MLHFYGKAGCKTNLRQRRLLKQAGVSMEEHNLLTTPWTPETLKPFFSGLALPERFNMTAPAIKSGEVDVVRLSEEEALRLMCEQPLLIRRPLLRLDDWFGCGFDREQLARLLGRELEVNDGQPDEGCRHSIASPQGNSASCRETEDSL